jgi:hypothetical protein
MASPSESASDISPEKPPSFEWRPGNIADRDLFLESVTDDQTKFLSTSQTWDDKTIDRRSLRHQVQLNPPLFWRPAKPKAKLGTLHDVPNEVIYTIFEHTPLQALMHLRATNSCAKAVVESWEPFKELIIEGPDLVRAVIATKAATYLNVKRLLRVVYGDSCELCGQLGSFIQLVKCMRCCFRCLTNDRRLHCIPVTFVYGCLPNRDRLDSALRMVGLDVPQRHLERIAIVRTVPRDDFWAGRAPYRGYLAIDYTTALELANPVRTTNIPTLLQRRIQAGKGRPWYRNIPPLIGQIHLMEANVLRFAASIYLPGRIKQPWGLNMNCDEGVFCRGCRYFWGLHSEGRHHLTHTMYRLSEIGTHLKHCQYAEILWDLVLAITSPNPANGSIVIPLDQFLAYSSRFGYRRSLDFGDMPWRFSARFAREYDLQLNKDDDHHPTRSGNNLIIETQANWALARPDGPTDVNRYKNLLDAWKVICKRRGIRSMGLHDL